MSLLDKFKEQFHKLKNYVDQLQQQNKIFIEKFERDGKEEFYKRLDYLYKTIELKEVFPEEFIGKCIGEIVSTITIPEEVKQPNTEEVK